MTGLVILLVVFYFLHSFLASMAVKEWVAAQLGPGHWYRLMYTIISTVLVVWIALVLRHLPHQPFIAIPAVFQILGVLLLLAGAGLSLFSVSRFGAAGFLGLRPEKDTGLSRTGPHGRIRHPIYSGIILMAVGWILLDPSLPVLVTVGITFLYLPVGIGLEENKLVRQFGGEYIRYRSEVPALWPRRRRTDLPTNR
jgi:methanethiol S-methyltransferase